MTRSTSKPVELVADGITLISALLAVGAVVGVLPNLMLIAAVVAVVAGAIKLIAARTETRDVTALSENQGVVVRRLRRIAVTMHGPLAVGIFLFGATLIIAAIGILLI